MKGKKVLLVESNAAVRKIVAEILHRHGFVVDTARDGIDAIEKIMLDDYGVILLDVMLPCVVDEIGDLAYLQLRDIEALRAATFGQPAPSSENQSPWTLLTRPFDVDYLVRQSTDYVDALEWLGEAQKAS